MSPDVIDEKEGIFYVYIELLKSCLYILMSVYENLLSVWDTLG